MQIILKGQDAEFIFKSLEVVEKAHRDAVCHIDDTIKSGNALLEVISTLGFDKDPESKSKMQQVKTKLSEYEVERQKVRRDLDRISRILDGIKLNRNHPLN